MPGYGEKLFGLSGVKIVSRAVSPPSPVDLSVATTMTFTPRMVGGQLKGSDQLVAVAAFIEALEWGVGSGAIELDAWAIMMGFTATESGSTPTRNTAMIIDAATAMPYFRAYGKALGEAGDDLHVLIQKAKVTGNIAGEFGYGAWYTPGFNGIGVKDGANGVVRLVQNETAAALPTT